MRNEPNLPLPQPVPRPKKTKRTQLPARARHAEPPIRETNPICLTPTITTAQKCETNPIYTAMDLWKSKDAKRAVRQAKRIAAHVFIPNSNGTISCPLNYFQENASLPRKWITGDSGDKLRLEHIDELRSVVITVISQGKEVVCNLPDDDSMRLLCYFNLDICHDPVRFKGFDCYAFVSLLAKVKYNPSKPGFNYSDEQAKVGDIIAIASEGKFPESIKHWALYLGDDRYLSKFGTSGEGSQSLVAVTNLKEMINVYDCQHVYIARPDHEAEQWDGYPSQ